MKPRLVLLLIAGLGMAGCSSLDRATVQRAPAAAVPEPTSTLYAHDDSAQAKYRRGFQQGYRDYLRGESSVSIALRYRSPDARLHGYADGKLEAMRFVKRTIGPARHRTGSDESSHEKQGWFDRYGEGLETVPEIQLLGKPVGFRWHGFR